MVLLISIIDPILSHNLLAKRSFVSINDLHQTHDRDLTPRPLVRYRSAPTVIEYATFWKFIVENSYDARISRFLAEPFKYSCLHGRGSTHALEYVHARHVQSSKFKVFVERCVENRVCQRSNATSAQRGTGRRLWVNNTSRPPNIQPTLARSREFQMECGKRVRKRFRISLSHERRDIQIRDDFSWKVTRATPSASPRFVTITAERNSGARIHRPRDSKAAWPQAMTWLPEIRASSRKPFEPALRCIWKAGPSGINHFSRSSTLSSSVDVRGRTLRSRLRAGGNWIDETATGSKHFDNTFERSFVPTGNSRRARSISNDDSSKWWEPYDVSHMQIQIHSEVFLFFFFSFYISVDRWNLRRDTEVNTKWHSVYVHLWLWNGFCRVDTTA